MALPSFKQKERQAQRLFVEEHFPDRIGYKGSLVRLMPEHAALNLAPAIRDSVPNYFSQHKITWHQHWNHALSS